MAWCSTSYVACSKFVILWIQLVLRFFADKYDSNQEMFHKPEFYPNISLKLSGVLEDIGVNERVILKTRRTYLLHETLTNRSNKLTGEDCSSHFFGSRSEGTTTPGLFSDTDILWCFEDVNVMQDWEEWEPEQLNLLMIQEETTPPGYCMLQQLHTDVPTAVTEIRYEHDEVRYMGEKVLLKNTNYRIEKFHLYRDVKNGPAKTVQIEGFPDHDFVEAFPFKRLPEVLVSWLQQQTQQGKLSEDMKRYIESNPCYVVPVGRKGSSFEEAEWRISTSHVERCLMFSLNITQLQCYIMLKFLLKTFLKHPEEKALSSFTCKNILLLCIGKTHPSIWIPQNLLSVFSFVLLQLKRSIIQGNCPHFILHGNNLMAQKFTLQVKRLLSENIQFIFETHGCAFLAIEIDDIGNRLQTQLNTFGHRIFVRDIHENQSGYISGDLLHSFALVVCFEHKVLLQSTISGDNNLNGILLTLLHYNNHGSRLEQAASRLLTPLLCSSLGSVMASRNIQENHSLSHEALNWLSLGLNSDATSSRLKLASVYFCVGDFIRTEHILRSIEQKIYSDIVEAACSCKEDGNCTLSERFEDYANTHNEFAIQRIIALCVKFLPLEVHCQPRELQYEMFRSTAEDRIHRDEYECFWMDWAVVDSLPYLYFLQYKTYGHLQKYSEQQQALNNLIISIEDDNYGHKETALNLLGQCYQKENRHREALECFMKSLNVRPTNNAAKLHICRLLYGIFSSRPCSDIIR